MAGDGTARAQDRLSGAASALPEQDAHPARAGRPERTALLFANVASRQGGTDVAPALEVLREGGVRVLEESPSDVGQLGAWILERRSEADLVIIGGGDGTLNAAADALVEAGLPLGILPLGTANDLARTLEIPSSLIEASRVIAAGQTRRIDLGRINGKHFQRRQRRAERACGAAARCRRQASLGGAGLSTDAMACARPSRTPSAPRSAATARGRASAPMQISVGNGRYYGGGMTIAGDAAIDDGMLDVVSLAPQGVLELILNLPALRWGWHERPEQVRHWRCRDIEIRTVQALPVNTDGEVTTRTPANIVVVPKALAVYVAQSSPSGREPAMLRDERQIALNEAVEASLHAAHVHEHGAALLGDDMLGLRALATQRRRDAEVLAEHIRQLGDLPMEPDPEYEVATDIVSQIKAALAEDQRPLVIERSNEAEEALAAALREALRHDLSPDTRRDLEQTLSSQADFT